MTSGFYEQLGVDSEASAGQLRAAYGRAVARLVRRRKAILEQGGDVASIDHARQQLDEAWTVLSDPVRRRRYDAMLRSSLLSAGGRLAERPGVRGAEAAEALWDEAADALIHPAAAVALKLLRLTTRLDRLGRVPVGPSTSEADPPTLVPHDDDLTSPRAPTARLHPEADRVGHGATPRISTLRVVDGSPEAPPVLLMHPPDRAPAHEARPEPGGAGREPALRSVVPAAPAAVDPVHLVDQHGYSGALLARAREARGLSLQDVADATRISVRYLEAIEADRFTDLPSATFVKGYVRELARLLGLDPEAVVAGYVRRIGG